MSEEKKRRKVLITEAYGNKKWMIGRIGEHHGGFPPKLIVKDDNGEEHIIYGSECWWGYHDSDKSPTEEELQEGEEQTRKAKAFTGELIQLIGIEESTKEMTKILKEAGHDVEITIESEKEVVEMCDTCDACDKYGNAFNLTNNSFVLWSNEQISFNDNAIIEKIKTFLEHHTNHFNIMHGTSEETNTTNTSDHTIIVRDINWIGDPDIQIDALFNLISTLSDDIHVAHHLRGL